MSAKRMGALALACVLLLSACALVCHVDHLCDDPACCPVCLWLSWHRQQLVCAAFLFLLLPLLRFFLQTLATFCALPCPDTLVSLRVQMND